MSQEPPTVRAAESDEDKSAMPAGAPEPADGPDSEGSQATTGAADDHSLEAILLQAGAKPPEPTRARPTAFKTLMGIGIEGLKLPGFGNQAEGAPPVTASSSEEPAAGGGTEATAPILEPILEAKAASAQPAGEREVGSLLDDVAQALNVQATEYRDRARGRLPGMPGAGQGAGAQAAGFNSASSGEAQAEFEDPEEDQTGLTPAVISVVDDADEDKIGLVGYAADEPTSVGMNPMLDLPSVLTTATKPSDRKSVSLPPVPGLTSAPAALPVGPPPGAPTRPTTTPIGGLALPSSSGRVRLPSPAPGSVLPTLPAPSVGRTTLPPGTMSPLGAGRSHMDLTATTPSTPISLEASRRNSGVVSVSARRGGSSGRVSTRSNARVTEPVVRTASPSLPAVLTAHVRLATLHLAGLIALTFAGGLLVGMLVWKGQGRNESGAPPHIVAAVPAAPATLPQPTVEATKPAPVALAASPVPVQVPVLVPVPVAPAQTPPGTASAGMANAATALGVAAAMTRLPTARARTVKEPVVAPLAPTLTPDTSPEETPDSPRKTLATTVRPARAKRVSPVPAVADASTPAPKASVAPAGAPKTGAAAPKAVAMAVASASKSPSGSVAAPKTSPAPSATPKAPTPPVAAQKSPTPPVAGQKTPTAPVAAAPTTAPPGAAAPASKVDVGKASHVAAGPAPSKPVGNGAAAKTAPKAKSKEAWRDPFAD